MLQISYTSPTLHNRSITVITKQNRVVLARPLKRDYQQQRPEGCTAVPDFAKQGRHKTRFRQIQRYGHFAVGAGIRCH
jgi:hypothetical protein